jgi:MOSC domain-containing protein YiiM
MRAPEATRMEQAAERIDSSSVGDPVRHCPFDHLASAFERLPPAPTAGGRLALVVRRREGGRREHLDRVRLTPEAGVPGDAWGRRLPLLADAQITVMQTDVAELVANGQPLALFGDNLFLDLDLSAGNLPVGSRVRIGEAVLEVTPKPHNGCRKFLGRFGKDALRFVAQPELRHRNLRGIYLRVVEAGDVQVGDAVEVLARGTPATA